jgi:outer membrane protein assembly factor BamC
VQSGGFLRQQQRGGLLGGRVGLEQRLDLHLVGEDQVGLALDRSGFTVEDRDRSKGTFFVRYVDPVRDSVTPGAFERVFGSSTKKDLSGRRYRIVVAAESSGARVGVLGEDGNPPSTDADRRVATQIVTLLRDQLR